MIYIMKQLRKIHTEKYTSIIIDEVNSKEEKHRSRNEDYIPFKEWLRNQDYQASRLPPKALTILGLDKEERKTVAAKRKKKRVALIAERKVRRESKRHTKG